MIDRPSSRLRRLLDRTVLGTLAPARRSTVVTGLRGNRGAREHYDRAIDGFRALEGRPISEVEYDLVEQWLSQDGSFSPSLAEARPGVLERWLGVFGVAVAVAAALVLVFGPLRPSLEDPMGVRGGSQRTALALEALCPSGLGGTRLRPAIAHGCSESGTLSFAYRLDARASGGHLALFGLDEDGDVMYYLPTPADPDVATAVEGTWQPLPHVVELEVNHVPGQLRIYGIVSPAPLSIDAIDDAAASLRHMLPATVGDAPWHERLPSRSAIAAECTAAGGCQSAELSFWIYRGESAGDAR